MAKGLAVGLAKGHIVSKIEKPSWVKGTNRKIVYSNIFYSQKESYSY